MRKEILKMTNDATFELMAKAQGTSDADLYC